MEINSEKPHRYTDQERQDFIAQWQQSGKNKMVFCKEHSLSYYSFNDWIKRRNKKSKPKPSQSCRQAGFLPVKVKSNPDKPFAELVLRNGTAINLFHAVDANYICQLIK